MVSMIGYLYKEVFVCQKAAEIDDHVILLILYDLLVQHDRMASSAGIFQNRDRKGQPAVVAFEFVAFLRIVRPGRAVAGLAGSKGCFHLAVVSQARQQLDTAVIIRRNMIPNIPRIRKSLPFLAKASCRAALTLAVNRIF